MQPRLTVVLTLLALALFVPLFIFRSVGPLDFWGWMSLNAIVLCSLCIGLDRSWREALCTDLSGKIPSKVFCGLGSSAVLYGVFFFGNWLSRTLLPFAGDSIQSVYDLKANTSPILVALLIGLVIGPGEEIFWRGFVQRRLSIHLGRYPGLALATVLYTFIHLGSANPMLLLAALTCGLFWGFLYLQTGSLLLVCVSHVVWDLAVFLVFPFGS